MPIHVPLRARFASLTDECDTLIRLVTSYTYVNKKCHLGLRFMLCSTLVLPPFCLVISLGDEMFMHGLPDEQGGGVSCTIKDTLSPFREAGNIWSRHAQ